MTLSSLLVSRDWSEVSVLECILGGLHIAVDVEPEPERARQKLAKSKIDALIVDCDLSGASAFLRGIESKLVKNSVPLVIISSSKDRKGLNESGAHFIFEKPISVEQAVHTLSAARNMILDGRLRYHRLPLDVAASLTCGRGKSVDAELLNVSQGGARVRLKKPLTPDGEVQVKFTLPGNDQPMKFVGEIAWMNHKREAGVRFNDTGRPQQALKLWLETQCLIH